MNTFNDFNNPQVAALPRHLRQYIVAQNYEHYTPLDHAVWRYVMRQNYSYLKDVAYYPYIPGLKAAGLTIEKIPHLQEMNDALGKIGWGAVTVDGFIPPSAFMEYQACRVLVIAADIRTLKHIEYTPAPDIIHESAGHAPIIADKDYHQYLSYFGSIGAKAIFSAQDFELYEAIRTLSILKEMADADFAAIRSAEARVVFCQQNMGESSEMALLSRLHWWTVEYGLIGTLTDPKIYGAGLLSSIGESASCMLPEIKKLPYTGEAINYPYDITKPQPQLFVTPSFQNLIDVLENYADTMSFRRGGTYGLQKAVESKNICTVVYSSGLQVSGILQSFITEDGQPVFIRTNGPTSLSLFNQQLRAHGRETHPDGFSSPVGKLKGYTRPLECFNKAELSAIGVRTFNFVRLEFESGVTVSGRVRYTLSNGAQLQLLSFDYCTVKDKRGKILFDPAWGNYDMAVGETIISVFSGAADKEAFEAIPYQSKIGTHHPVYDPQTLVLQRLYGQVRYCRETKAGYRQLQDIWETIKEQYTEDWLCALEILEILLNENIMEETAEAIRRHLQQMAGQNHEFRKVILDGLALFKTQKFNK